MNRHIHQDSYMNIYPQEYMSRINRFRVDILELYKQFSVLVRLEFEYLFAKDDYSPSCNHRKKNPNVFELE